MPCFHYFTDGDTLTIEASKTQRGKTRKDNYRRQEGGKQIKEGRIQSAWSLIYILSTSNSAINFVVFLSPPRAILRREFREQKKLSRNSFSIWNIYVHALPFAQNMLNGIWRGWMGEFFREKNCRGKLLATHLTLLIAKRERQQTSGITKTKLKFFIDNKRRERQSRWGERDSMPSYLLIWSHFKLSLRLPSEFRLVPGSNENFSLRCCCCDRKQTLSGGDSIGSCAHPQKFLVLVCW